MTGSPTTASLESVDGTQSSAAQRLAEWVAARDRKPTEPLTDETLLFADRRITSLDLPELIGLLEELREAVVDIDQITPESFATLAAIDHHFLS